MVICSLRVLGDAPHRLDPVQKCAERDRSAQGALGAFPAGEFGQCGVDLFVR